MGWILRQRRALLVGAAVCAAGCLASSKAYSQTSMSAADVLIFGANGDDQVGEQTATAGDVNGDGHTDFLIGSTRADGPGESNRGRAYLVLGSSLSTPTDLDNPPSGSVVVINGALAGDRLASAIAGVGDVNNDGFDDIAIGAARADYAGRSDSGTVYLIYGSGTLPSVIDVENLGPLGVVVGGASPNDRLGSAVSGAGDVNGDGFDDLLLGAPNGDPNGRSNAGEATLLFGSDSLPTSVDLATPNTPLVLLQGQHGGDNLGNCLAGVGDVNGDTWPDFMLGAKNADPNGGSSGEAYLIFGQSSWPGTVDLRDLPAAGLSGCEVRGASANDRLGHACSGAGDIDGDGFLDLIVAANEANRGGLQDVGEVVVIFGSTSLPAVIEASNLGSLGFKARGLAAGDQFGVSVAGVGDVSGDGRDDLLIGASRANPNGRNNAGAAYLIHGRSDFPALLTGADYLTYGVPYEGIDAGDQGGFSVAAAGDLNGDGGRDFVISANCASPLNRTLAGEVYVFYGETLLPPTALSCSASGTEIALSWTNPQEYDTIEIYRDGDFLTSLNGTETSYEDVDAPVGLHVYQLVGLESGNATAEVECSVSVIVLPPLGLSCSSDEKTTSLSWMNGQSYTSIRVLRDGVEIAVLPGSTTLLNDPGLLPGSYLYCVIGETGAGQSTETCCELLVPDPVDFLSCTVEADEVTLAWTDPVGYDELLIERDGTLIVTVPGEVTSFTDIGVSAGSHEYRVLGAVGSSLATGVTCLVEVVPSVADFVCEASGFEVQLSWTGPIVYDSIEVTRDGVVVATLPGDQTSYLDMPAVAGLYDYGVRGLVGVGASNEVRCEIELLIEISNFTCSSTAGDVFLSWTNGQIYDEILVRREGVLIATLPGIASSFLDESLPAGVYEYQLTASGSTSAAPAVVCEVVVLDPPTNLDCLASGNQVALNWSNRGGYDQLLVYRDGALLAALVGSATSYVDTVPAGSYAYEVTGVASQATSAAATCEVAGPGAPSGLSCVGDIDGVEVNWINGAGYDSVSIEVDGNPYVTLPGSAESAELIGLALGTHVICVTGVSSGNASTPVCCQISIPLPLVALDCQAQGGSVLLSWTNGEIYQAVTIARDGLPVATVAGFVEGYTDVVGPGEYEYSITASIGTGETLPLSCAIEVLEPISSLSCNSTGGAVALDWTSGEAYDSIEVYRNGLLLATLSGLASSFDDFGLSAGFYNYQVRGVRTGSSVTLTSDCSLTIPLAPFGLTCALEAGSNVSLNWSNSQVGDEITVSRDGVLLTTLEGTATSFADPGLAPGLYTYCVRSRLGSAESVATCCEVRVPIPPAPFDCVSEPGGVLLTWTPGESYDSVLIFRNGLFLAAVPGSESSLLDPTAEPGAYTYTIVGFVAGYESAGVDCTVTVPFPPSNLTCTPSFTAVELTWTLPLTYDSINLLRNGQLVVELPGDALGYTDLALSAGSYAYEVCGVIGSDHSPAANCLIDILAAPLDLICCSDDGAVTLSWVNPLGYDSIEIYRSGFLVATLGGGVTEYSENFSEFGSVGYDVVGRIGEATSLPGFCSVGLLEAPVALSSSLENPFQLAPEVRLTWDLGDNYDSVQIFRNRELIATVSGVTDSFLDVDIAEGSFDYHLVAQRSFGDCSAAQSESTQISFVIPVLVRCDANNDLTVNIADSVFILNYLFQDGPFPSCFDQADCNDDGSVNLADTIYLNQYQFTEGPPPPAPFPDPGFDPTDDNIGCEDSAY